MKQYVVLQPWVDDKQYKPGDIVVREEADAEGLNAFIPGMLREVTAEDVAATPLEDAATTPRKKRADTEAPAS